MQLGLWLMRFLPGLSYPLERALLMDDLACVDIDTKVTFYITIIIKWTSNKSEVFIVIFVRTAIYRYIDGRSFILLSILSRYIFSGDCPPF
jgi:hypothetical protein